MSYEDRPAPHVRDLAAMLRRRWKLVASFALGGALLALVIGGNMPPRYTAKAQLLVARSDVGPADAFDEAVVDTHVELILSPSHVREVQKSLAADPGDAGVPRLMPPAISPLSELTQDGWRRLREVAGGIFRVGATDRPNLPQVAASPATELPVPPVLIDFEMLSQNLNIYKEQRSRVIAVTFTAEEPQLAANIANRVAEIYVKSGRDRLQARRERIEKELAERIPVARTLLERAEAGVRDHRIASGLLDQKSVEVMDRQIAELRRQRAVDQARLADRETRVALLHEAGDQDTALDLLAEIHDSFGAAGSALVRTNTDLDVETDQRAAGSTSDYGPIAQPSSDNDALKERLHRTRQRLESLEQSRERMREAEAKLRELEREADASAQLYETLLRRQTELAVQDRIQQETHIVSAALPPEIPSSPSPILFVLPAFVAFAIGGGMASVMLERFDRRVRSERDVEESVGIPCVGLVPAIRNFSVFRTRRIRRLLIDKPFNPYAEAIRSVVATALSRRRVPIRQRRFRNCAVFAVTSGEQGEGKTTLANSFAVSAGSIGQRVLLIDLDFRNPGVANALGALARDKNPDTKTSDVAERAVRAIPNLGIDYLPLADRREYALSFLSTNQLSTILDGFKGQYDCIVIDSPPLLGATESRAIVSVADNVIFALKWGATDAKTARRAIDQLRHAGIKDAPRRVFGVVTQVNVRKHRLYQ